jgi:hypothetical protein
MTGARVSTYVAFGLKAQALAMQAKAGRKISMAERLALIDAHARWLVTDVGAAVAVIRFVADVPVTPFEAGEALLRFLDTWAEAKVGPHARACEDVLRATDDARAAAIADPYQAIDPDDRQGPVWPYAWQERADLR